MKDLSRLLKLKEENDHAGALMSAERGRFQRLKGETVRTVTAFNLFQTPEHIADKMMEYLPTLNSDSVILEPSAGLGRIYKAIRKAGHNNKIILVENSADCMKELYDLTNGDDVELVQRDFLTYSGAVDAVIMNPPFKMGLDIKHIMHALTLLKDGGRLIALCYNGVKQNKHLKPIADHWEILPSGSFKESGTNADVVLLIINKKERTK